jgi:leader peptidase (prepilin peptidase)/N-methyltransferase
LIQPELELLFTITIGVVGLLVGSFLNVAIHRLPLESETVSKPRRSRCPSCRKTLSWSENVPVFSWLVQLGKCRGCGWRIPFRYPLVELLNAGLWLLVVALTGLASPGLLLIQFAVISGLLVATFVDFDCFEIPDEISIGGMILAPIASFALPALHDATFVAQWFSAPESLAEGHVDRLGALMGSLAGMAVGGGVLIAIGWLGSRLYKRDAMGFGDVKLLAAGGAFVGPGGALAAMMIGSVLASVVGLLAMGRFFYISWDRARSRGNKRGIGRTLQVARIAGRYIPFGPYLGMGIGIALLAWEDVLSLLPQLP